MKWNYTNKYQGFIGRIFRWFILNLLFILSYSAGLAQIPEGVPHPDQNTPIDFSSWADIVIYIILPAVLIIGYFIMVYHRRRKRDEEEKKNNQSKN